MRPVSSVAPEWWDYTTIDTELVEEAARLTPEAMLALSRDGFRVVIYDKVEEFYLAEALEYIDAWRQSTPDNPCGICGPIGPTEQLPLVARIVNSIGLDLKKHDAHFWGMDEWVLDGKTVDIDHPLSFAKADMEMCFSRIDSNLAMPDSNLHFPLSGQLEEFSDLFDSVECIVMQGGQGDVKHWAFNDPLPREGEWKDTPPPPEEYRKLPTRIVDLHPIDDYAECSHLRRWQYRARAHASCDCGSGRNLEDKENLNWHAGQHDNPFGMRLTTLMIARGIADSSVPMSLLAAHPNVQFNFYRPGLGTCEVEMH